MDRRQILFGATTLVLSTNLSLNHLLMAQVGNPNVGRFRMSDRERYGLRGSVKTCTDFFGDEAEPMSHAEYTADGRLMVWRGRLRSGSVERVYSYDETGKLINITIVGADETEEFHYDEQGRKTTIRTIPPRPSQQGMARSAEVAFETSEEGDDLNGGGSVTTRYNDNDQPIESLVRDAHGVLITRITHDYADGRLVSETLATENLDLPQGIQEELASQHLSEQQLRMIRSQMKEMLSQRGLDKINRSYFYDNKGRVSRMTTRAGDLYLETSTTYNEYGDEAVKVRTQSGSLGELQDNPKLAHPQSQRSEVRYSYQYDSHSNWTQRTTLDGPPSTATSRKITYY